MDANTQVGMESPERWSYALNARKSRILVKKSLFEIIKQMADASKAPAAPSMGVDVADLVKRLVKYALEGLAVAVACYLLPGKKMRADEIGMVALTALAVFAILDIYAPSVGSSARTGAGFGIGANLVGFPIRL
jgi:hypothetical protein